MMQASVDQEKPSSIHGGTAAAPPPHTRLRDKKVGDMIADKRRLVEVPYNASLADTANALIAHRIMAVPVAAPPGEWIGAGGSMIVESDKQTGAVRKHYIGMVTMLDVLAHIAGNYVERTAEGGGDAGELDLKMQVPVSSIIGHCLESLSLWTLNYSTSILDCMEVFSKGIHRALVPVDGDPCNAEGVELMESASSYRMFTQMDLLKLLRSHDQEIGGILRHPVRGAGAMSDAVFGVTDDSRVFEVIKCMNTASLYAVPIVKSTKTEENHGELVNGKGRKLVGTFSATDLRGCPISQLQAYLYLNVIHFINQLSDTALHKASCLRNSTKELITCKPESLLGDVVDKAINNHVHRVWVVDDRGSLVGLISLTDIIKAFRVLMLSGSGNCINR